MKIIITNDYKEMSRRAACFIAGMVRLAMAIPSGSTPLGLYQELVRLHCKDGLDLSRATFFLLDEYYGLSPQEEGSFYSFVYSHFIAPAKISAAHVHAPDTMSLNAVAAGRQYEKEISSSGGLDLAVLGIGHNGHIGFNEPARPFNSRTGLVTLSRETISANKRFFKAPANVPRQAISMGLATITEARQTLLLASGAGKAKAVAAALEGPVTIMVPASCLQLHPASTAVIDAGAASLLKTHFT
jgi:glucosamine-6-phosphate deaminase